MRWGNSGATSDSFLYLIDYRNVFSTFVLKGCELQPLQLLCDQWKSCWIQSSAFSSSTAAFLTPQPILYCIGMEIKILNFKANQCNIYIIYMFTLFKYWSGINLISDCCKSLLPMPNYAGHYYRSLLLLFWWFSYRKAKRSKSKAIEATQTTLQS